MNTISEVEATLRLTKAAPALKVAVDAAIDLVRQRYCELRMVALVNMGDEDAEQVANQWLSALWLLEEAVRQAVPQMQPKSQGVVEMRRAK